MPGLTQQRNYHHQFSNENALCTTSAFWSKHRDDISFSHLQKFWSELSPEARQDLLKIDKQTILEQARKNMYCSRCNGLLLEGFMQIVMYGKSSQTDGTGGFTFGRRHVGLKSHSDSAPTLSNCSHDDIQDPAVHPWGGLTTAKDGTLTVLSTYIFSKSLKGLQNVFDSARARERERELLYPDACGGGGRGWISQGIASYGRGHGTRETCALHTARLSCDTLVDFWSALGDETRQSLLRMKEEDFIERLMYRFDSKRFCRDCRKNVIREFKELKELKRIKREPRCTNSFCVADSVFQYQVSDDAIRADWRQTFMDAAGTYHHFEWAVGTGEGKSDILEFESVGMNRSVNVNGLDLGGLTACYITVRAWKRDGRCTELCVKAHALKGQQCVHSRLVVGDGYVSINRGESIRRFFEHAEEAEEEEDDDMMDKDGNELDGECTRPQKHAKSPELAREFLLDAATVIFKEQVEKAFREGTARQNAHSIFVCLVSKLLEERMQVACKEIITLEKQTKLLEEEEKEKREEEERKERRRMKEREKKLRRKERLKEKEKGVTSPNQISVPTQESKEEQSSYHDEENNLVDGADSVTESTTIQPASPQLQDEISSDWHSISESRDQYHSSVTDSVDYGSVQDDFDYTTSEYSEVSFHGDKHRKEDVSDSASKWSDRNRSGHVSENVYGFGKSESKLHGDNFEAYSRKASTRQFRVNGMKSHTRNCTTKHVGEKFHTSNSRIGERYNNSCSCNYTADYRESNGIKMAARSGWEPKKVWEPMDLQKKYPRRNSESDMTLVSSTVKVEGADTSKVYSPSKTDSCSDDIVNATADSHLSKDECDDSLSSRMKKTDHSVELLDKKVDVPQTGSSLNDSCDAAVGSDSNSENCYSSISEGDSNLTSNTQNLETTDSSDSEDASQQSDNQNNSHCVGNDFTGCLDHGIETTPVTKSDEDCKSDISSGFQLDFGRYDHQVSLPANSSANSANSFLGSEPQVGLLSSTPPPNQNLHFPVYHQAPSSIGYYHPSTIIWPAPPTNGLIAMPRLNQYVISSPVNYGWNGSPGLCMPYGGLPHLEPHLLNHCQIPVYHPVTKVNSMYSEEQLKNPNPTLAQEIVVNGHNKPVIVPAGIRMEEPPNGRTVKQSDSPQVHTGKENNNGFSLFHFGGPVALASTLKNGCIEDFSLNNLVAHAEVDNFCSKKEAATIEEYSLFAANNGFKFSF